jgi:hypothetical protein
MPSDTTVPDLDYAYEYPLSTGRRHRGLHSSDESFANHRYMASGLWTRENGEWEHVAEGPNADEVVGLMTSERDATPYGPFTTT